MPSINWSELAQQLSEAAVAVSLSTQVSCTHSGLNLSTDVMVGPAPSPAQWVPAPAGSPAGEVLTIALSNSSSDSSENSLHVLSENATFNYMLSGAVTTTPDGLGLAMQMTVTVFFELNVQAAGVGVFSTSGNVINITASSSCNISTDPQGRPVVTPGQPSEVDQSVQMDLNAPVSFNPGPLLEARAEMPGRLGVATSGLAEIVSACLVSPS